MSVANAVSHGAPRSGDDVGRLTHLQLPAIIEMHEPVLVPRREGTPRRGRHPCVTLPSGLCTERQHAGMGKGDRGGVDGAGAEHLV